MRTPTRAQRDRLAAIASEVETIRVGAPCPFDQIIADLSKLVASDSLGIYSVAETPNGWQFDRFHVDSDRDHRIRDGMLRLFGRRDVPVLFYDIARPARAQRNRLFEATAMIDAQHAGGWRQSALCREVLEPLGLGRQQQHRILLCEGASLLAWFGAFHCGPLEPWQQSVMRTIAAPLRRRLRMERCLGGSPRSLAALDAVLANVGAPAFVVTATGAILTANPEGRRALAASSDVRRALHDTLRGRPASIRFDLTEIRDRGVPTCCIAIARPSPEVLLATSLARATTRWRLTSRQTQVLALVLRGLANQTIAAELTLSTRAVELHVSALLGRVGVDNRAALVSAVFTA